MKTKVKKGEVEEVDKIVKPEEEIVEEKVLKLQYSKQFFIRFPKSLEELLGLKEGKKIKFIVRIPHPHKKKEIDVRIKVIE